MSMGVGSSRRAGAGGGDGGVTGLWEECMGGHWHGGDSEDGGVGDDIRRRFKFDSEGGGGGMFAVDTSMTVGVWEGAWVLV